MRAAGLELLWCGREEVVVEILIVNRDCVWQRLELEVDCCTAAFQVGEGEW